MASDPKKRSHGFLYGFVDVMFFRGLGNYRNLTEGEREEKRVLFDMATPKTQKRWWRHYFALKKSEDRDAARAFGRKMRRGRKSPELKAIWKGV